MGCALQHWVEWTGVADLQVSKVACGGLAQPRRKCNEGRGSSGWVSNWVSVVHRLVAVVVLLRVGTYSLGGCGSVNDAGSVRWVRWW